MTKSETLHIRITPKLKAEVEPLLNHMGLSLPEAVNLFLSQVVISRSIPFTIRSEIPNSETLEAMQEVQDMIDGKIPKNTQSIEDLFEELGIDVER